MSRSQHWQSFQGDIMTQCVVNLPLVPFDSSRIIKGETPTGELTCTNFDFRTANAFYPNTLEVLVDGRVLTKNLDYEIHSDNMSLSY